MKKNIFDTEPFNRFREPPRQNIFLLPLIWIVCWFLTITGKLKIKKTRMNGLKPPFIVLGTHHSFMDFYITPLALFPHRANYISELEGFENFGEWIYRQAGCLGTRKFISDMALIGNIRRVIKRKDIIVLYPEARYTNDGTFSGFPESVGKLCKLLDVPVVTINMHGNYLQSPIWNLKKRKGVVLKAELTQLFTKEELANASVDDINKNIVNALDYNEYDYQQKNNIAITYKNRAEGLENILYTCPNCLAEHGMTSEKADLFCAKCSTKWHMTETGQLKQHNQKSISDFSNIPYWYNWQRECVKKEIDDNKYTLDIEVEIESLPNAKNFIPLGKGRLIQNNNGFILNFKDYGNEKNEDVHFSISTMFSIHTEYNYRNKGQCITLSTVDNTYFIYPTKTSRNIFNVTKIQFATEYFYEIRK